MRRHFDLQMKCHRKVLCWVWKNILLDFFLVSRSSLRPWSPVVWDFFRPQSCGWLRTSKASTVFCLQERSSEVTAVFLDSTSETFSQGLCLYHSLVQSVSLLAQRLDSWEEEALGTLQAYECKHSWRAQHSEPGVGVRNLLNRRVVEWECGGGTSGGGTQTAERSREMEKTSWFPWRRSEGRHQFPVEHFSL